MKKGNQIMSNVWVCADLHLGHSNITKYRPQFSTAEEHHAVILDNVLSCVGKRDKIFFLGDIVFKGGEKYAEILKRLAANTVLVLGNHDGPKDWANQLEAALSYKGCWLTHIPIHEQELDYRKFNIHGHLHGTFINDPRYFNASLEHTNFKPVLMKDVLDELIERNN